MKALIACLLLLCGATLVHAADAARTPAAAEATQVLVLLNLPPPHFRPDGNYTSGYADAAGSATRRRIAASLARSNGLSLTTDWPMPILGLDCYVMDVPPARRADDVAALLARDPRVAWAQPMNVFRSLGHNDPLFSLQPAAREWHLGEMHETSTGHDVRVAIIDSGVQLDHPDLVGQVAMSANFVAERGDRGDRAESHGTAVAGIVAARADNHVGIAGVAPRARLFALRACRQASAADTLCTSLSLALALHAAIDRGAQIINLSLGGPPDRLIEQLVEAALARGVSVVAAADRTMPRGGFPAGLRGVVAVVDEAPGAAPAGMVAAPGTDVPATLPGSRWALVSGASYAAAHVSGLLALMLEAQARAKGTRAAVAGELVVRPDGRIDTCASLSRAATACACDCATAAQMAVSITQP
ncbi:MAG: S8 family serine peptidase [Caldimonas sp.]